MRSGYACGALARVAGDLWQGKAESIDQPASPGLRQHRQLPFEQSRLFPGAHAFRGGLEQFGQQLVRALAFSLEVGPMAVGNSLRLDQFGLQALDFLLQGGDHLVTGLGLRLTDDRGMADFGEVDLYKRLAVVGAGTRPSMSFYQSPGSLRGNCEPFAQFGIRQHLDGHDIPLPFIRTVTTRTQHMVPIYS